MAIIHPYLSFNGNCREAMQFYQSCFGGELQLQTVGETSRGKKMPPKMKNSILHARLTHQSFVLFGTDITDDCGLQNGNSMAMYLHCSNKKMLLQLYRKLSKNSRQACTPQLNAVGAWIATVKDPFEKNWLLHCVEP